MARPASPAAPDAATVEQLVRRVLAQLLDSEGDPRATAADSTYGSGGVTRSVATDEIRLDDRVISIDTLARLPATPTAPVTLRIARAAVVTPAAHDELRRRGMELRRDASPPSTATKEPFRGLAGATPPTAAGRSPDAPRVLVADAESAPETGRAVAVARQLGLRGVTAEAVATAEELLERVAAGATLGLLLADLPAPHVCRACRDRRIGAAAVSQLADVDPLVAAMPLNLAVLDLKRLSLSAVVAVASRLARTVSLPAGESR